MLRLHGAEESLRGVDNLRKAIEGERGGRAGRERDLLLLVRFGVELLRDLPKLKLVDVAGVVLVGLAPSPADRPRRTDCSQPQCLNNCSSHGACLNGTCWCKPGFGGLDCALRTCPGDCSGNGWCRDGECLCYPEYGGDECNVHAENSRVPMKCALNCVHSCLGKCSHIYTADGIGWTILDASVDFFFWSADH